MKSIGRYGLVQLLEIGETSSDPESPGDQPVLITRGDTCMQNKTTMRILPALVLAAFSGASGAAGFQLLEQNASGIGNAYAGSAALAENASTVFVNPAGMTQLQARQISLGFAAVRPNFEFTNTSSSNPPAATGTNANGGGDFVVIPNAYVSMPLAKDLYLGVGLGAPFGLITEYDDSWVGRFQATKFDVQTINLNPSLAYRVNEQLSVGGGVNYQQLEATYERFAAVGVPPFTTPALNAAAQSTKVQLKADDTTWGWNVGATLQAGADTRLGLSYRSRMKYTLDGTLNSTNQAISPNVGAAADIELPDTWILSAMHKINDRLDLLADVSWTGWSSIQKVNIIRTTGAQAGSTAQTLDANFQDSWRVALGANYGLNEMWKLKLGIAYDQTPVNSDSERLVSLPDNDRLWLTIGTQWKVAPGSALDLGLAYLQVKDTKIDNNQTAQGRGRVTGEYDSDVLILGAQYSTTF
jgi:long-chain fatty acid transport protein